MPDLPPPSRRLHPEVSGWTLLWAHDPQSRACDVLVDRVIGASASRGACHVEEIGSVEESWVALDRARRNGDSALVLACLDLPPVPRGGLTVAKWARSLRLPCIAVAHGRRWLSSDGKPEPLIVMSPTADPEEVARALAAVAVDPFASRPRTALKPEDIDPPPESFPGRPSWLG